MNIYELQATLTLDTGGFRQSVEEAGTLFRSLGESIGNAADGMSERAEGIAGALGAMLSAVGGENGSVLSAAAEGTAALFAPFDEGLGERIGAAAEAVLGFGGILAGVVPFAGEGAAAQERYNAALDRGSGSLAGMAEAAGGIPAVFGAMASALGQWAAEASSHWASTAAAAQNAGDGIASVFGGTIPQAAAAALGAVAVLPGEFSSIGAQMAAGLEGGFSSLWAGVTAAISKKVSSLVNGVKDLLGIRSPSRVFADIGGNMAKGLSSGWSEEFGAAERLVLSGIGAVSAYGGSLSGAERLGFEDSAIGRSSAAGIASLSADAGYASRTQPVEIRLLLDGVEAAEALYDPLERVSVRRGTSGRRRGGYDA